MYTLDSPEVAWELTGTKAVQDRLVEDIAGGTVVTPHNSANVRLVKALIILSGNALQDIVRHVAIKDTILETRPAEL